MYTGQAKQSLPKEETPFGTNDNHFTYLALDVRIVARGVSSTCKILISYINIRHDVVTVFYLCETIGSKIIVHDRNSLTAGKCSA